MEPQKMGDESINQIENTSDDRHSNHRSQDDDASSIRSEALGDNLPPGYFYSLGFIGTVAVSSIASLDSFRLGESR
jgi:hypothetical protein